ncbi:hypothetical protein [Sulfuriroseicoccus oceanibius]|uniref:Uncharacterized protein n=1 Tax=Sulfuriroseicoccus oceanibius TaxID=2707525 RepID=A0A6B3L816_9BACT|nr:hypothetical protein [Sulfuriroseicoccus oceanibius]QQL44129.1 hypothetical protein G3M56_009500 [Sulfuriroseicoccus oceanibius]
MQLKIEIEDQFDRRESGAALLYAPSNDGVTFRRTRLYVLEVGGDTAAATTWMERVVLDQVSQKLHVLEADGVALSDADVVLEYGMKPGALDHEREILLDEFAKEHAEELGFQITDVRVRSRIYLYAKDGDVDTAPYVRDVVNPAVHSHELISLS